MLSVPPLPEGGEHLFDWFLELSAARGAGMSGPLGISYSELLAWSRLTGRRPAPWEVEILRALDAVFLAASRRLRD